MCRGPISYSHKATRFAADQNGFDEMPAYQPEQVDYELAHAFNDGDLERACSLYEAGAGVRRLAEDGGTVATGDQGIREAMARYVNLTPTMRIIVHHVTRAGDIALLRSQWIITGTDTAGAPIELSHNGIEVVRQQADGTWKFVIDHPYGADPEFELPVADIPAPPVG
ncbi:nuclear transport factor 2 family protein [Nocardia sp. JCM 34519]|uniref:YybH family protein n=2 Tax=unclassified Nocardia TaxID=2637762 RepID=UPI001CE4AE02|nr:nuclear transport factor 2 family protein [Nocardia sp. JCM 34519]